jgi:hypothetical protein
LKIQRIDITSHRSERFTHAERTAAHGEFKKISPEVLLNLRHAALAAVRRPEVYRKTRCSDRRSHVEKIAVNAKKFKQIIAFITAAADPEGESCQTGNILDFDITPYNSENSANSPRVRSIPVHQASAQSALTDMHDGRGVRNASSSLE